MAGPEQALPLSRGCPNTTSLSPPRGDRTLLVRHLPAELSAEEKEDLLKYFGAQSVRVLSDKGRLALTRLHQLKLLGHTLVVEFAKEQDRVHSPCPTSGTEKKKRSDDTVEDDKEKKEFGCLTVENGIAPNHGLTFPLNSCLKYMYPPPSSTILANIVNALASVPKFYVQYEDYMPLHAPLPPTSPRPPEEPPLPDEDEELSSKESEYESSDEEDRQRMTKLMELANLQPKRPKITKQRHVRKKQKIKDMLNISSSASQSNLHPVLLPSDVFDQPQPVGSKRIEFHISADMPNVFKKDLRKDQNCEEKNCDLPAIEVEASSVGFGKIFPKPNMNITEETKEDSDEMPSECISRRELEKGRISREASLIIFLLPKFQDLKFIFGRYVDFSSETQRIMFDIRLMKEGRMKGQAFIGLPNEKAAAKALKEANGYVLFGKPMVVYSPHTQHGRTSIVHLFEWRWADIAAECERYLGPKGFGGVQVRIYVDAVINHMCAVGNAAGTSSTCGSYYNPHNRDFPAVPYSGWDFNDGKCKTESGGIENYKDAFQVRDCRLSGLLDLALHKDYVRSKIADYLNNLIAIGVAGFRLDASKHMWPGDIKEILHKLHNLNTNWFPEGSRPFIYQEVIDLGGEAVKSSEYFENGRVTEFKYGAKLGTVIRKWNGQKMSYLKLYKMAVGFMLAHPYGITRVMSSYYWQRHVKNGKDVNDWTGPPNHNGVTKEVTINPDTTCGNDWICEHRWRQIRNMVAFRNVVDGQPFSHWWDNGSNQVAFGRGTRGFIVFNNDDWSLSSPLQTGLPAGTYCDVISGDKVDGNCTGIKIYVSDDGKAHFSISNSAEDPFIAIHLESKL
ncbi:Alpha-amylase 1 [Fukomys damarensis]|uniref:RNA-binding region-containing protein 3 n=1 Tax=Fukomys damarensis TaxID=885580 RepID=A0A091D8S5_FUKDA|nr:Alpha-amylase 1 [Fukomys damarensis]